MVGKMTIREDLDALMENLNKMTQQLESLNKNVVLVQTRVTHCVNLQFSWLRNVERPLKNLLN